MLNLKNNYVKVNNLEDLISALNDKTISLKLDNEIALKKFFVKLSKLYCQSFGFSAPRIKFHDKIFRDNSNIGGSYINGLVSINLERPETISDDEKLISLIDTLIHETTHYIQHKYCNLIYSGEKVTDLNLNNKINKQIIVSSYIKALIKCLEKLYKENILPDGDSSAVQDITASTFGNKTLNQQLNLNDLEYYGNNPAECSARKAALNFISKINKNEDLYSSLQIQDEEYKKIGTTDVFEQLFCNVAKILKNPQYNNNKEVIRLQKICLNLSEVNELYSLLLLAFESIDEKYSKFNKDIMKQSFSLGNISKDEYNSFLKDELDLSLNKETAKSNFDKIFE